MVRLSIKRLGDKIKSEVIDIRDKISIGRNLTNDIVIKSEKVSRQHCLISVDQNNVFVTDLNSRNGAYVNDKKITKIQVHPNDVLQIGQEKFRFILTQEPDVERVESDKKKDISRKAEKKGLDVKKKASKPIELKSIMSQKVVKKKIEEIIIKPVAQSSKEFHCSIDSIYTIGRLHFSDIFIDDKSVSRTHARIDVRENRAVITDAGSRNGTYVNDEKITVKELHDGDTIEIGEVKFVVSFVMISDTGFTSYKKSENFNTIDLLKEQNKILEIYKDEYGERVLLEVERQTLLFCQEFENHFKSCNTIDSQRNIIAKMVRLLSNSERIFDGSASEILTCKDSEKEELNSNCLQKAQNVIRNGNGSKIVYFEETDPNKTMKIRMNGLALDFNEDLKILVFEISYDNILYLVYASSILVRYQNMVGIK